MRGWSPVTIRTAETPIPERDPTYSRTSKVPAVYGPRSEMARSSTTQDSMGIEWMTNYTSGRRLAMRPRLAPEASLCPLTPARKGLASCAALIYGGLEVVAAGQYVHRRRQGVALQRPTIYPGPKGNFVFNSLKRYSGPQGLSAPPGHMAADLASMGRATRTG